MEENGNKVKMEHRVTKLEVCHDFVCEKIENIELQVTNHIPTELKAIRAVINKRPTWLMSGVMTLLGILITTLIALTI